ncbi:hypothetical protein RHMOL_Rhmol10G0230500 [Rhododendron molle]|uniref:Uncharacterized protein n=1 Tax=Rhododendron molle TaxID=49168 RepID=A0ACC0M6B5_RHOML|nr:hypothetical protein RHMOL_Rhmol10G0230500 [Rhododendron molle]
MWVRPSWAPPSFADRGTWANAFTPLNSSILECFVAKTQFALAFEAPGGCLKEKEAANQAIVLTVLQVGESPGEFGVLADSGYLAVVVDLGGYIFQRALMSLLLLFLVCGKDHKNTAFCYSNLGGSMHGCVHAILLLHFAAPAHIWQWQ